MRSNSLGSISRTQPTAPVEVEAPSPPPTKSAWPGYKVAVSFSVLLLLALSASTTTLAALTYAKVESPLDECHGKALVVTQGESCLYLDDTGISAFGDESTCPNDCDKQHYQNHRQAGRHIPATSSGRRLGFDLHGSLTLGTMG